MSHITEMMPNADKWPDWAKTAFEEGNFFEEAVRRVEDLENQLAQRSALQRFMAWIDRLFPNN